MLNFGRVSSPTVVDVRSFHVENKSSQLSNLTSIFFSDGPATQKYQETRLNEVFSCRSLQIGQEVRVHEVYFIKSTGSILPSPKLT